MAQTRSTPVTTCYAPDTDVDTNLLSLDIYQPDGAHKPCPVIVFIHGGGWCMGDKREVRHKPDYFTGLGYLFVSINYRLSTQPQRRDTAEHGKVTFFLPDSDHALRFPCQVQDVAKALGWIHNHIAKYNGDPDRIGLLGHSAGAHLACLLSTDETYLQAEGLDLKVIKATVDLDAGSLNIAARFPEIEIEHDLFHKCILSCYGSDPKVLQQASPTRHVAASKAIPPFLLVHQQRHQGRSRDHQAFHQLLHAQGHHAELFPVALNHGQLNHAIGQTEADSELSSEQANEAKRLTAAISDFFNTHL